MVKPAISSRGDNWFNLHDDPPKAGSWVWMWGPEHMSCVAFDPKAIPDGAWVWTFARTPHPPVSEHEIGMNIAALELGGHDTDEQWHFVKLLGWEEKVGEVVEFFRERRK